MVTTTAPGTGAQEWDVMASLVEALEVDCPECGQLAGVMCVYMPIAMADPQSNRPSVQARLAKVGKPTQHAHNARSYAAKQKKNEEERKELRRLQYARSHPKPVNEVQQAMMAWERQEHARLHQWLAAYGVELFGAQR